MSSNNSACFRRAGFRGPSCGSLARCSGCGRRARPSRRLRARLDDHAHPIAWAQGDHGLQLDPVTLNQIETEMLSYESDDQLHFQECKAIADALAWSAAE